MWQLQSHHVALDHSRKEVMETPNWHEDSDSEAIVREGDRLTWLKLRSTTVPAHRTWDWGPAVFTSCRFCSRIFKKQNKNLSHCKFRRYQSQRGTVEIPYSSFPGLPLDWCSLEWTGWQLPPGERRHPLTTVMSTSTKVKQIYWLAWKTKNKKLCRLHKTKIKNHAELKKKKLKCL